MSQTDYERIESAIQYLSGHYRMQPDLKQLADHVGLSEYHFHRLFQRWAGTTPKRFLQYLTAAYARKLLRQSHSLLEVSYETGLSSTGRLHDLIITLDGMTPGELRHYAAGIRIQYGFHQTPFGLCMIATTTRGICGLEFCTGENRQDALERLKARWCGATFSASQQATAALAKQIFSVSEAQGYTLRLVVGGSNLQLKVWEALLRIPPNQLINYQHLAETIGHPRAARAIGTAVAANPVLYLIPCHRVIRSTGIIGAYQGGQARKKALIGWEAARCDDQDG